MPAKSQNRKILLVGSVPLANSKEVFSESAARLGELIPRIPDGETGIRTMWILRQKEVMAKTKNLKVHHQLTSLPASRRPSTRSRIPRSRLSSPH